MYSTIAPSHLWLFYCNWLAYKKAVLWQGTTARCATLVYIKLALNPQTTQWIERTLKHRKTKTCGSCRQTTYIVSVKDWCILPHGIKRPPEQSSRNSGNKFRLTRPPNAAKFCRAPSRTVRDIHFKNLCSRKSRSKFTLGHQIYRQSIGHARVSMDTL